MKLQRMCAVCRVLKQKDELLRIVKQDKNVSIDPICKIQGRGAYICKSEKCIKSARKVKALERSLSTRIDSEVYDAVEAWCENGE